MERKYTLKQYSKFIESTEMVDNGKQIKLKVYVNKEDYSQHSGLLSVMIKSKLRTQLGLDSETRKLDDYHCIVVTIHKQAYGNCVDQHKLAKLLNQPVADYV